MAKKWSELKAKCSPETIARAEQHTRLLIAAIELDPIRRARRIRHSTLDARLSRRAKELFVRDEPLGLSLAALRETIEAMGGELRLTARFPDAEYELDYIGRANGATA